MDPQEPENNRPLVLVVSASVGAGHNQAARAIVDAIDHHAPELRAEWLDILPMTPRLFRAYYAGGYALTVTKLPLIYGIGFWLTDHPQRPGRSLEERRRLWTERLAMRKFADYVCRRRPVLIVNTHFLSPPLIGRLIASGHLAAEQMVVVTDNQVHRFWYARNVRRWFLSADCGRQALARWGIDDERITVSGMPVHAKWTQPLDRDQVLADWRLPADRKIVLVSGGADFTCGPVLAVARRILHAREDACVVVLAGRNKRLLARLARPGGTGKQLIGVAFTDRAHELVHVASLMVTKAGGSTTAECLAKGTPMVLLKSVPGQEAGNARYFQTQGAAVVTHSALQAADEACRLLADPDALGALAANARRLYRPATETILAAVREAAGQVAHSRATNPTA